MLSKNRNGAQSRLIIIGAVCAFLMASQSALATTYFVRTIGSDQNLGTTRALAFATPSKAASVMVAGDIVYIGAGVYTSQISPLSSGTALAPIKYVADTRGKKTGDAGEVIIQMVGVPVVNLSNIAHTSFEGFTFRNGSDIISITGGSTFITIEYSKIQNATKYGILLKGSDFTLFDGLSITGSKKDGILVDNGGSVTILESTISGNRNGIMVAKGLSSANIERSVLTLNLKDGVTVKGGASAYITNTLSSYNKNGFVNKNANSIMEIRNCTAINNTSNGIESKSLAEAIIVNTISAFNGAVGIKIPSAKLSINHGKKKKNQNVEIKNENHKGAKYKSQKNKKNKHASKKSKKPNKSKSKNPVVVNPAMNHSNNLVFGNKGGDWKGYIPDGTNLNVDPKFVSASDYQLSLGSPARNAGIDVSGYTTVDFGGKMRPEGGGWDIGCYEGVDAPPIQYVRTTGSDANSGLSPSQAFRTIQRAINQCSGAGCTIYVGPGIYRESLEIGFGAGANALSGSMLEPNYIFADLSGVETNDAPGDVIIDGKSVYKSGITIKNREHWVIDGVTIRNQKNYGVLLDKSGISILNATFEVPGSCAITGTTAGDIMIADCVFNRNVNSSSMIWIQPMAGKNPATITITRNDLALKGAMYLSSGLEAGPSAVGNRYIRGIGIQGIAGATVAKIEISNNQVSDCYTPVYVGFRSPNAINAVIANNTVVGSFYGTYTGGFKSGNVTTINNIIDTCYYGMLDTTSGGRGNVVQGILENNITLQMARFNRPYALQILTGNPLFVDAPAGDFSLAGGSPGIDSGFAIGAPAVDYFGDSRPTDGNKDGIAQIDIGAYETINTKTRVRVVRWIETGTNRFIGR